MAYGDAGGSVTESKRIDYMFTSEFELNTAVYGEVKNRKPQLAILPWGATEPHGYHLPYGTDNLITSAIACMVAEGASRRNVDAMVLPCIPFGPQNRGQVELPFCLHSSLETMRHIFADVVESLERQGINKLIVMIGHGGDTYGIKALTRDFSISHPGFDIVSNEYWNIISDKGGIFGAEIDDHAGEEETSLMLYLYPEFVKMELAGSGESKNFALHSLRDGIGWMPRDWSKSSIDSGIGDPRNASAEKGKRYLNELLPPIIQLAVEFASYEPY